jgi:integrase
LSLYKRGRIYWSRIVRGGETFVRSTKCKNRADAIRVEAQWVALAEHGNVALRRASERTMLAQFETRFFDYIANNVASPKTQAYYKTHWVPLRNSTLGGMDMSRITPAHIHDWVTHRSSKVKAASVNGSLRTLRRALRLASEWNVIKTVPKIRIIKGERSREFVIDEKLLTKMLAHERCTTMLKSLIPFLVDTGLRLNEAMSLNWGNVNLREGSVFIERGKSKNARRTVPLTPRARKIVETLHEKRSEERVFPLSSFYVSHQFRGLRDEMELPDDCVLHSCRHTFCTRLGTAGVSAFQIMRLAGHSSVAISQRYVHEDQQALKDAIAQI